jgi:hypothetical protein
VASKPTLIALGWFFIFCPASKTPNANMIAAFSPSYQTLVQCNAARDECIAGGCRADVCVNEEPG